MWDILSWLTTVTLEVIFRFIGPFSQDRAFFSLPLSLMGFENLSEEGSSHRTATTPSRSKPGRHDGGKRTITTDTDTHVNADPWIGQLNQARKEAPYDKDTDDVNGRGLTGGNEPCGIETYASSYDQLHQSTNRTTVVQPKCRQMWWLLHQDPCWR